MCMCPRICQPYCVCVTACLSCPLPACLPLPACCLHETIIKQQPMWPYLLLLFFPSCMKNELTLCVTNPSLCDRRGMWQPASSDLPPPVSMWIMWLGMTNNMCMEEGWETTRIFGVGLFLFLLPPPLRRRRAGGGGNTTMPPGSARMAPPVLPAFALTPLCDIPIFGRLIWDRIIISNKHHLKINLGELCMLHSAFVPRLQWRTPTPWRRRRRRRGSLAALVVSNSIPISFALKRRRRRRLSLPFL